MIRQWIQQKDRKNALERRHQRTLEFVKKTLPLGSSILDMGTRNSLSELLENNGYKVLNTKGEDLDEHPEVMHVPNIDAVTSFEICEHLLNPLGALKMIQAPKLYLSVPLQMWFANAYRNPKDRWDQHFHEFEPWQVDWLLEKAGWKIVRSEKWKNPVMITGIRPLLRSITDRYYILEAKKIR